MTEQHIAYVPVPDPKGTREALCAAQSALAERAASGVDAGSVPRWIEHLDGLVAGIDRHRPLGPDGKHGDLHTSTCGCEREAAVTTPAEGECPGTVMGPL